MQNPQVILCAALSRLVKGSLVILALCKEEHKTGCITLRLKQFAGPHIDIGDIKIAERTRLDGMSAGNNWLGHHALAQGCGKLEVASFFLLKAGVLVDVEIRSLPHPIFAAEFAVLDNGGAQWLIEGRMERLLRGKELTQNALRGAWRLASGC